jgi:DNA-binding response OmpR family regulator
MKRSIRVLIVEDEFLIGMELTTTLEAHGFEVMGPVATVGGALEILQHEKPNAVILDLNLRGQAATAVAIKLRELNLPFVIASAYSNTDLPQDDSLRGIENVGKPTNGVKLIQILHRITDSHS